ncbi:hypothetical protein D3C85_83500 [compost metagenome]
MRIELYFKNQMQMKSFFLITLFAFKSIVYSQGQKIQQNDLSNKKGLKVMDCKLPSSKLYQKEEGRIYRLIEGQVHYLRGLLHPWKNDLSMLLITKSESGEHCIRPNATFAADLAFLYRFGNFDEKVVGTSRELLLSEELIPLLRYLVRTHKTGDLKTDDGKSWGDAWQSAHWTAALGNAAWWSWKGLPEDIKKGVCYVVGHEADRIEGRIPPHQVKLDSKSEENAWNSQVLSAALLLMPEDPRCTKWELAVKKWSLSAYLRDADASSIKNVDNIPISKQFTGANIYNDFSLENHDIVHPDYMGAWIMNAGNDLDYLLTGRKTSETFLYNLSNIYNLQKRFFLPDGGYCYPNGQDWALFRNADWMPCHATAVARFNDPEALYYLHNAIDTAEKMQARNSNGAIYAPGENFFPSAQPHLGYWLTQSWLILHFAKKELSKSAAVAGVNYLKDGNIILRRDSKAIQTVSWGKMKMIQMMPMMKDHIVSPDQRNGIGRVVVKNSKDKDSILAVTLKDIEVKPNENGFYVKMVLYHGDLIQSNISCKTNINGSFTIKETLTALKECSTNSIETLTFGILNNPNWVYESGKRNVKIGNQSFEAIAGSDLEYLNSAATATVDSLLFEMDKSSVISYKVAKEISRSRFTDMLVLNSIPKKQQWKQDEVISERQVTIAILTK